MFWAPRDGDRELVSVSFMCCLNSGRLTISRSRLLRALSVSPFAQLNMWDRNNTAANKTLRDCAELEKRFETVRELDGAAPLAAVRRRPRLHTHISQATFEWPQRFSTAPVDERAMRTLARVGGHRDVSNVTAPKTDKGFSALRCLRGVDGESYPRWARDLPGLASCHIRQSDRGRAADLGARSLPGGTASRAVWVPW